MEEIEKQFLTEFDYRLEAANLNEVAYPIAIDHPCRHDRSRKHGPNIHTPRRTRDMPIA